MPKKISILVVESEEQIQRIGDAVIAVCSYETESGQIVNGIDISYSEEFPELKRVTVLAPRESL